MRVIVSTEKKDIFNNFVVVDSLKKALDCKGVDTLIMHKSNEEGFDAGVLISKMYTQGVSLFLYICNQPEKLIDMAIKGAGGFSYEDEFYLEDEDELLSLIEDIRSNEGTSLITTTSASIIGEFIQNFMKGDERLKAPLYLQQVENAVNELCTVTHQQELQIKTMGSSAVELFKTASDVIKNMDDQTKIIEQQLRDLESKLGNAQTTSSSMNNSVTFFTSYKYSGSSKVLLIREMSPCRYLTSFVLGYTQYLRYTLNKRVKLIFVVQKGKNILAKYDSYTKITEVQSAYEDTLYSADIVVTNNPKRDVMKKLMPSGLDLIIVVDRLYGGTDIVTGRVTRVNALSGKSDLQRFNLKPDKCIFPVTSIKGELFSIPTVKEFPQDIDSRYMAYQQVCLDCYEKLDKELNLVK